MNPVLQVQDYSLEYATPRGAVHALVDVDLVIRSGEVLGLVGESGSGKTSMAWSIMRYLPRNASEPSGAIRLLGVDLLTESQQALDAVRGRRISMVFQDPSTSLNPTLTLGDQLTEVLIRHRGLSFREASAEGVEMLRRVGLKDPLAMLRRYPHEVSGGEKQRVVIASAFACRPECILFDEPTTALDVITGRQILDLFAELQAETKVGCLYISHDLALVSQVADRVAVMHKGRIVEQGDVSAIFNDPKDAYTQRLLASVPRPANRLVGARPAGTAQPLVETIDLSVNYGQVAWLAKLFGKRERAVVGNRAVSLSIGPAEILGVVGESGSGKSTLAKALTGLNRFDGELLFDGARIEGSNGMNTAYRRDVQIIFQHPDASLNPRQRIGEILSRPLRLYGDPSAKERGRRVAEMLEEVQLAPAYASRFPHQLSGGEKQRVAIARAFASRPRLVICDEITSALDVSVQMSIMELLIDLQRRFGTAYLFITHDLNLVRQIAHRIAVMYRGSLVDLFPVEQAGAPERHAYTRSLLDAVPMPAGLASRQASHVGATR